jgi:chemotaxis protein methyltransferase CheR
MGKMGLAEISALTDRTFNDFRELIYRETGISLRDSKHILISNRLRKRLIALGINGYDDYYRYLTKSGDGRRELQNFIDAVSTNETYFYRGDNQFTALSDEILPKMFKKQSRIKVWSAGCSSGEEPYTICTIIMEAAGITWKGDIEIVATDINTEVIEKAGEGIYSGRTLKFVRAELLERYFDNLGNENYRIKDTIKQHVKYKCHNLLKQDPPGSEFDIIFCRNVMIYFDKKTQRELVDNSFRKAISDKGYLFIGHSESLMGKTESFKYAHICKAPIYLPSEKRGIE